jgi:hypothetical protein
VSAIFPNTVTKWLSASTLTGLSSNGRLLLCAWFTWDGTAANSSNHIAVLSQAAGDGVPGIGLLYGSTPTIQVGIDSATLAVAGAIVSTTWYHAAVAYGEWDNTSNVSRGWRNGVVTASTATSNQPGIDLAYLSIGRRHDALSPHKGRVAQVGVWATSSTAQEDTIVAAAQLYNVDTISPAPAYSWRLASTVAAATGGVALTNNGTVTFDGADNPTLTDLSGGGSVLLTSSFM